ncbi:MAG: hypothetical protein IKY34_03725 [Ruminiclostridium sp.]|nr:hypothetical protein [Ruminiclostridium sp.]
MLKKVIATVLCFSICVVPAFAAMGKVYCDIIPGKGSTSSYDYARTQTSAIENRLTDKSKVMNIFAKAWIIDYLTGTAYGTQSTTSHYVLKTSATSGQVTNSWSNPTKVYIGMGQARTRYTDNTTDEHNRTGHQYTLGGQNAKAVSVEPASTDPATGFGSGKGDAMIALIYEVYGYDLSEYTYVPACTLDTDLVQDADAAVKALADVNFDVQTALRDGDHTPFGYLYQGNVAYTVVEQPDGSLTLTQYQLTPPITAQKNSTRELIGKPDIPLYQVTEVENAAAERNVIDTLYK